jgi:membrane-bound lytic murein transglycosylase D
MLPRTLPVLAALVVAAHTGALAQGPGSEALDLDAYRTNPRVRHFLEYFQGPGRDRMAAYLARGASWQPLIAQRFASESLPSDLGYLALIESGYSNAAVSRSRAVGMWQFMQGTGREYGLRIDPWVDERRDPVRATDAAARHLRDLQARFGSPWLAAAAYNAGAGRVSRGLDQLEPVTAADSVTAEILAGDTIVGRPVPQPAAEDPFFRLAGGDLLAGETRDYVPQLIAAALIARAPARYGFAPAPGGAPLAFDTVVVSDATSLDVIARLAGVPAGAIRTLNPQYLRRLTPPAVRSVIRVPAGLGEQVAERYASLSPRERAGGIPRAALRRAPPLPPLTMHRVRSGETLAAIAQSYQVTPTALRRANALPADIPLRPGMRLRIPG